MGGILAALRHCGLDPQSPAIFRHCGPDLQSPALFRHCGLDPQSPARNDEAEGYCAY